MSRNRAVKVYSVRKEYRDIDYRQLYRFDKCNVEWMTTHFLGGSTEKRGAALTNKERMEIFLRALGDPGFQISVGAVKGCHQSTVSKTLKEVSSKVAQKLDHWIKFPSTNDEMEAAVMEWSSRKELPNVLGAIDCTHVQIIKPQEHGNEYFNRKGFPSINVQATCNALEWFSSVDASWPGSVHDSRIWRNSNIYRVVVANNLNAALLGDQGYGLTPWMLTPYKEPSGVVQNHYNKQHLKDRVTIERCFGQLKRRFPMLSYTIRLKTDKVAQFIVCGFILHNVAKYLKDPNDFEPILSEAEQSNQEFLNDVQVENRLQRQQGQIRRDQIAQHLYQLQI